MLKKSTSNHPVPAHGATHQAAARATSASRLASLDCLRGAAILAIALANAPLYLGPSALAWQPPPHGAAALDVGAYAVLRAIDALQLYLVFALLFGYGLGVQLQRSDAGGISYVRTRLLVLAVIGTLHGLLLWYGDILLTYAVGGALAVALRDLRRSLRLTIALALLAIVPLLLLTSTAPAASDVRNAAAAPTVDVQLAAYRSADLGRIVAQRLADTRQQAAANLVALPAIIALMLVGMEGAVGAWAGRLATWARQRPVQLLLVLGSGLVLTQGSAAVGVDIGAAHTARLLGAPCIAVAVLAWLLGRENSGQTILGQQTLVSGGRLSISIYVMQSLAFTSLAYGYGWGTYGTWSPGGMLIAALAIAATGAILARAIGTCWSVGPVEWLWRWATRASVRVAQRGITSVPRVAVPHPTGAEDARHQQRNRP